MKHGGRGIGYSSGVVVLVPLISGGLLTAQSCLLKEIFGNNRIAVRRGGDRPSLLANIIQKVWDACNCFQNLFWPLGNFPDLWKEWAPLNPTVKLIWEQTSKRMLEEPVQIALPCCYALPLSFRPPEYQSSHFPLVLQPTELLYQVMFGGGIYWVLSEDFLVFIPSGYS